MPAMSVLRNLERTIAGLVEGTFGRVFRTEVRPVELARKLAREMDEHRTVSVARTYVPNEYAIWLSPEDHARYEGMEREVSDELSAYLLEHARRERYALVSRPHVTFRTDEGLRLGEFGIQARLVRPDPGERDPPVQAERGRTMVYSTAERLRAPVEEVQGPSHGRALLVVGGRRHPVPRTGATLGRSRDCEVVVDDVNVSRRHAEVRPGPEAGSWTVRDLGSTNGTRVNGRPVTGAQAVRPGDRLELGTAEVVFDLE